MTLDPDFLAFLGVLAAAAGADLALAIVLLGVMPLLGWLEPPGSLPLLQAPPAILSALILYLAESVLERFPSGFALWHTFQRWVRVLGLLLLSAMATEGLPLSDRVVLGGLMTVFGFAVYMGASGWEGLLLLRQLPQTSRRLTSLAIDIGFGALLVLALEEPRQAILAMNALMLVALFQLRTVFRAHWALLRAGRSWLRALVFPGKWVQESELPSEVVLSASHEGPIPGKPLRGAEATLLDEGVRLGWLVLATQGPLFIQRGQEPVLLSAIPGEGSTSDPLHVRKPVRTEASEGELLVFKDGPRTADLELVIPPSVS